MLLTEITKTIWWRTGRSVTSNNFHSQLGRERGDFDIGDVIEGVCEKMIRRHPHIFGDITVKDTAEVLKNWEDIKKEEKHIETQTESMKNVL